MFQQTRTDKRWIFVGEFNSGPTDKELLTILLERREDWREKVGIVALAWRETIGCELPIQYLETALNKWVATGAYRASILDAALLTVLNLMRHEKRTGVDDHYQMWRFIPIQSEDDLPRMTLTTDKPDL